VIPSHQTENTAYFLARLFDSIAKQTFRDYEIIIAQEGTCGGNLNAGIKRAKGEIIKIICQDDWFAHENSLKDIVENFKGNWMITGCHNNPRPFWTDKVPFGYNTLGGLSVIVIKNDDPVLFREDLLWMIDVEFYQRIFKKYGEPTILDSVNVKIGLGSHQSTNLMSEDEKLAEFNLVIKDYG
jgi:glycosyltransferase involved in cell wall biosynthesis